MSSLKSDENGGRLPWEDIVAAEDRQGPGRYRKAIASMFANTSWFWDDIVFYVHWIPYRIRVARHGMVLRPAEEPVRVAGSDPEV